MRRKVRFIIYLGFFRDGFLEYVGRVGEVCLCIRVVRIGFFLFGRLSL